MKLVFFPRPPRQSWNKNWTRKKSVEWKDTHIIAHIQFRQILYLDIWITLDSLILRSPFLIPSHSLTFATFSVGVFRSRLMYTICILLLKTFYCLLYACKHSNIEFVSKLVTVSTVQTHTLPPSFSLSLSLSAFVQPECSWYFINNGCGLSFTVRFNSNFFSLFCSLPLFQTATIGMGTARKLQICLSFSEFNFVLLLSIRQCKDLMLIVAISLYTQWK